MIIAGVASAELAPQPVLAMNGLGRKILGLSEGHAQLIAQAPKRRQYAVPFKTLKDLQKHGSEVAGGDRIGQRADLIITRPLLHVEEGGGVIVPFRMLQPTLVFQQGWRLGEKEAKGAQDGIVDGVLGVGTRFAMVRQMRDASV
jgi:hypothetical protein